MKIALNVMIVAVAALTFAGCEDGGGSGGSGGNTTTTSPVVATTSQFLDWQTSLAIGSASDLWGAYVQTDDISVMWPVAVPGSDGSTSVTWNLADEKLAQEALFTAYDSATFEVEDERIVQTSDDSTVVFFTGTLVLEAAGVPAEMPVRATLVYVRTAEGWRIVHEHMSVDPAG